MKSVSDVTFSQYTGSARIAALSGALLAVTAGCARGSTDPAPAAPVQPPPPAPMAQGAAGVEAPEGAAPQKPQFEPPLVIKDQGLVTPESVYYDAENDVYLVSNVNGKPLDVDGNGFISKITPDGKVSELKWIESGKKGATLNAPKGMGIAGDTLYVSDITFVRLFDKKSGEPKGKVGVPGATFLNDIAVGPDGVVYVSDSGLKAGKEGFDPTGSDAIYKIGPKGVEKVVADKALGGPNGLLADENGVWVTTFTSGELYYVSKDGQRSTPQKLPMGGLDGIVRLADGSLLIASWAGSAVFRGTPGGTFEPLLSGLTSPADIAYDSKRNAVVIPGMMVDTVTIQKLPPLPAVAPAPAPAGPSPASGAPPSETPAPAPAPAPAPGTKEGPPHSAAPAPAPASPASPAPSPASPGASAAPVPGPTPKAQPSAPQAPAQPSGPSAASGAPAPTK